MKLFIILFLSIITLTNAKTDEIIVRKDLIPHKFKELNPCFVIYDIDNSQIMASDTSEIFKRYSPCSTFKIYNSLIAFEAKTIDRTDHPIKHDSTKYPEKPWMKRNLPFKKWMRDQTLDSAIKYSVVWYFKELAKKTGEEKMQRYLDILNYGNQDISSGIDNFWLCNSIKISTYEQLKLITDLYNENIKGFSKKSIKNVKKILPKVYLSDMVIYAKTGTGDCAGASKVIAWYVGYVESEKGNITFAFHLKTDNYAQADKSLRIEFIQSLFEKLKK